MNRRVSPFGALMQVAFSSWVTLHSTFLFGDVIELKNGTKLQGKVTKGELGNTPSDIEITFEDGVIVEIPSSQIAKIVPPGKSNSSMPRTSRNSQTIKLATRN